MANVLRFVLAIFVVIAHLTDGIAFFSHWGVFAVFGFYIISGYLITLILNVVYGFKLVPFVLNRFIRLFPTYYIVALFSLIVFWLLPEAGSFHPAWIEKRRPMDYLGNVLVFPFEFYDAAYRVSPPTWSVAVELINYFLLWLLVARSQKAALVTLLASLVYHTIRFASGGHWHSLYFPFYAAMLPFSIGSYIWFIRKQLEKCFGKYLIHFLVVSLLMFCVNLFWCGVSKGLESKNFIYFFYVNLIALIILVACITSRKLEKNRKFKLLGDLAYPVFLVHWIVAYVISETLLDGERRGGSLLTASVIPIVLFSWVLVVIANKWFEPLRDNIRNNIVFHRGNF